jgi:hypothetical protein
MARGIHSRFIEILLRDRLQHKLRRVENKFLIIKLEFPLTMI